MEMSSSNHQFSGPYLIFQGGRNFISLLFPVFQNQRFFHFSKTKKKQRQQQQLDGDLVSTHLKNISQIGSFPQVGVKMKKIETTT